MYSIALIPKNTIPHQAGAGSGLIHTADMEQSLQPVQSLHHQKLNNSSYYGILAMD